jgi:hypothetical protein
MRWTSSGPALDGSSTKASRGRGLGATGYARGRVQETAEPILNGGEAAPPAAYAPRLQLPASAGPIARPRCVGGLRGGCEALAAIWRLLVFSRGPLCSPACAVGHARGLGLRLGNQILQLENYGTENWRYRKTPIPTLQALGALRLWVP